MPTNTVGSPIPIPIPMAILSEFPSPSGCFGDVSLGSAASVPCGRLGLVEDEPVVTAVLELGFDIEVPVKGV